MFSRMESASTCPTCKRPAKPHAQNPAHPFCSRRCKLADLSNWFNERYAVPADGSRPEDEGGSGEPDEPLLH